MAYIGKNVIENLTTAMYENLKIIFREYIQNSADAIDKAMAAGILQAKDAEIHINIEPQKRKITVDDNGYGIPKADFKRIMESIADSQKRVNNNKGFRGIGRLGGISACDELRFITSAVGETVESVCIWDAKLIKEILADQDNKIDAASLVDKATTYKENSAGFSEHYFRVELINVGRNAEDLLNVAKISDYISAIAPVPYRNFCYKEKIKVFAKENGFSIDEYRVFINQDQIYKPYVTDLYESVGTGGKKSKYDSINDVKFEIFTDNDDKPIAWMWYGISNFEKQIPVINKMRAIRLRKGNIQIGDEQTLTMHHFFKEPRGHYYFVGEIFAISPFLIPNARRDYFNVNDECCLFEERLKSLIYDSFYSLYHKANEIKKNLQCSLEYQEASAEFKKKLEAGRFVDEASKNKAAADLRVKKEKAEKAEATLNRQKDRYVQNGVLSKVYKNLREKYSLKDSKIVDETCSSDFGNSKSVKIDVEDKSKRKQSYLAQGLTKYSKKEQKLVSRIYNTIQAMLPPDQASYVIEKIQEDLMK